MEERFKRSKFVVSVKLTSSPSRAKETVSHTSRGDIILKGRPNGDSTFIALAKVVASALFGCREHEIIV